MNLKQMTVVVVSAGAMLGGTISAASAASAPVRTAPSDARTQIAQKQFQNVVSGMCLDTKKAAGNQSVRKVKCHNRGHRDIKHQLWILDNDRTVHSLISPGNCLSLRKNTNEVVSEKCGRAKKQQWTWSGGRLKNVAKKKCLTLNHHDWLMVGSCSHKNSKWRVR
ncbi:ricin-type beta-trefoil lectin domain protein [Spirillospora sp. NPDC048911]|uniref:ricin-type beta-trefoil lectin domain protein n=1 Tax=Spirillospora sp. NPDC048911 TaxID=3364527 RepID=UPI00371ABC17